MIDNTKELIPVSEYCRTRGIGVTTLYKLLGDGKLRAVKVGAKTLITAESDREWRQALPAFQSRYAS